MLNPDYIRKNKKAHTEFIQSDAAVPALTRYEPVKGDHDKAAKKLIIDGGVLKKSNIDISWLPAAAETYRISADPEDYVLVDVPIVTVDIPNRNMQAFPFEEVAYFDPEFGKQIYKTFIGKPACANHDNADPLKAKGVHFDASMEYLPAYGIYKIRVLTGFDRTKDPHLVKQIIDGKRTGYSMGAMCGYFLPMVKGTRVATKRGLIPIEDVVDGDILETKGRPQRCGGAIFRGFKDVVKIHGRNSIPVTASLDHTFLRLNPDLTTSWVEAGNLNEGDYVAFRIQDSEVWPDKLDLSHYVSVLNELDTDSKKLTCAVCSEKFSQLQSHCKTHGMTAKEYKEKFGKSVINGSLVSTDVKFPTEMTPELASLLGYFISEGSFGPSRAFVGFSGNVNKPDLIAHYEACFEKCFGSLPSDHNARLAIVNFFEFLGVEETTALGKRIPWSILQAPKDCAAAFLRAYWEGDGSATSNFLSFYTASEQLAIDTRLLLSKFGIASTGISVFHPKGAVLPNGRVHPRDLMMYRTHISGTSVDKYMREIGVTSEARAGDAAEHLHVLARNITQLHEEIPYGLENLDKLYSDHKHHGSGNPYYKFEDGSVGKAKLFRVELKDNSVLSYGHFDRYNLMENIRKLDSGLADRFQKLLDEKLWWVRVSHVERSPVQQPVYCIKDVEVEHNFTAEGFVVHNCSVCGATDTNVNPCRHMDSRLGMSKGQVWDVANQTRADLRNAPRSNPALSLSSLDASIVTAASNYELIHQHCVGVNFIELSSVEDPADVTADVFGSGLAVASCKPIWLR